MPLRADGEATWDEAHIKQMEAWVKDQIKDALSRCNNASLVNSVNPNKRKASHPAAGTPSPRGGRGRNGRGSGNCTSSSTTAVLGNAPDTPAEE